MTPLLEARRVARTYRRQGREVRALDGVSVQIAAGATTALVGRSGSGKSTLARCLALLESPDRGEILLDGRPVDVRRAGGGASRRQLAKARRSVQLVVQDPIRAINPRFTVAEAVTEPLRIAGVGRKQRTACAGELLQEVQLDSNLGERPARRLSGGQIQRLALARALACGPRALILDEALSGLDLSVRARLLELLGDLQRRRGLAYVLLSHDRPLVDHLADRVYVLERGRLAEDQRGDKP